MNSILMVGIESLQGMKHYLVSGYLLRSSLHLDMNVIELLPQA